MKNLTLEMSLKPFKETDKEYIKNICAKLFNQWKTLADKFEQVSVLLWIADGSEILDYKGNLEDSFEWAYFLGSANPREEWDKNIDPEGKGLHVKNYLYIKNPPVMTYRILKDIISSLKYYGQLILNKKIRVGGTFDPGPEFAKSDFKYNRHNEICFGNSMGKGSMVCSYALLNGDNIAYAGFPDGIPDKTPFGTFLGKQVNHFLRDMNLDYIWFSNGFGFGVEAWHATGAIFDGKHFDIDKLSDIKEKVLNFWKLFRKECPDYPVETRGTNMSLGIDYSTDGVPLGDIYNTDLNITPPPNSPWAAINGDFGLELMGYMSRIAELPANNDSYIYRFYLHDPWWVNSPYYDRYGGKPHDIYLPLAVTRIDENGKLHNAQNLNILTINNSYGEMPESCVYETLPHFLKAIKDSPDEPSPIVWIYPFSEYSSAESEDLLNEMYYNDWYIRGVINYGMPLSSVVSTDNFIKISEKGIFDKCVLISPVPQKDSKYEEKSLQYVRNGGKIIFYGSVKNASKRFIDEFGLKRGKEECGELIIKDIDGKSKKIFCSKFTNNGGIDTYTNGKAEILSYSNNLVLATKKQQSIWIRGLTSSINNFGKINPIDLKKYYAPENTIIKALAFYGYCLDYIKDNDEVLSPVIMLSRSDNAFMFNVFMPDMTVMTRLKFPLGAPVMLGTETKIINGYSVYNFPKAEHFECRIFVVQNEGIIKVKEIPPVSAYVRRRIGVFGLKNATIRFFPEKYCQNNTEAVLNSHPDNYFIGDEFCKKYVSDEFGNYIEAENITGNLVFSMPVKKYIF
jgi:hypothetical protein